MCIACWVQKATDERSECVIVIAFPLQQWLHECTSVSHYIYIHCLSCFIVRIYLCMFLVLFKVEPDAPNLPPPLPPIIFLNCFAMWNWSTGKLSSEFIVTLLVEYVFMYVWQRNVSCSNSIHIVIVDDAKGSRKTLSSKCDKLATSGLGVTAVVNKDEVTSNWTGVK
jgi:hypothetical protein